jgi:hypothetical protein
MSKSTNFISIVLFLTLVLGSCNLPADEQDTDGTGAALTAAAQTVEANLTQSAVQNPPGATATPIDTSVPTATLVIAVTTQSVATSTQICDRAQFIEDVNVPDGTNFDPNDNFTKTWRLKNTGSCSWSGYSLVFDSGDAMSGPASLPIGTVAPGQEVDLSVDLTAPSSNGTYRGYWRIKTNGGVLIPIQNGYQGKSFYVEIKVGGGGVGSGNGEFAVTSVNTTVNPSNYSGPCTDPGGYRIDFTFSAEITTNAAGTVTYKWERSDNANAPEESLTFNSAGTKTVTSTWSRWFDPGDNDTGWKRVYINEPNHQTFSQASFTVTCDP